MVLILPLKQLATIQVSLPNSLIVQVWDKVNVSACEKAIQAANLGVSTIVEGSQIRVILPPLSQERRDQIFQLIKKNQKIQNSFTSFKRRCFERNKRVI